MARAASMSYFETAGPSGDPVTSLGRGLGVISLIVLVVVLALLLWGLLPTATCPPIRVP